MTGMCPGGWEGVCRSDMWEPGAPLPGPLNVLPQEAPSCHSRCRAPPGTREAPLGNRLGMCVCVCVCCCCFHLSCFQLNLYMFLKMMLRKKTLKLQQLLLRTKKNNQILVIVCDIDKRDESLAELVFVRMFEPKVSFKGSISVIHNMFCPLGRYVKANQMVYN